MNGPVHVSDLFTIVPHCSSLTRACAVRRMSTSVSSRSDRWSSAVALWLGRGLQIQQGAKEALAACGAWVG